MSKFYREFMAYQVKQLARANNASDIERAFDGDAEAAFRLSCFVENDIRGIVAVAMWRAKVPVEAFRAYFSSVWDHDHRYVIQAAQTRRRLAHMFRYAAFPLPAELPELVTVWRGTSKISLDNAKAGHSWTTDRDTACWFAMRFAKFNGSPLVLTADVEKTEIALFHNERDESEVVLIFAPSSVSIDGGPDDWWAGYERWQIRKAEHSRSIATV